MIDYENSNAFDVMVTGGDSRITVKEGTTLNAYGCSAFPGYSISYSSCTGSTIMPEAYAYAQSYLHYLKQVTEGPGESRVFFTQEFEKIRQTIKHLYETPEVVQVVLGSSGTDLELVMLAGALASGKAVHNVVLSANEVGSGIGNAARGQYFSDRTPTGDSVRTGNAISGFDNDQITYADIAIREWDGAVRSEEAVMADYRKQIDWAIQNGKRALVHTIHRTKTGLIVPTLQNLSQLMQDYRGQIDLVVDACQGRISIRMVNEYLKLGASVLITGSKFFSGPPFSGALLLPQDISARLRGHASSFPGLSDFFTRYEFPEAWSEFEKLLNPKVNIGLLLRWSVAIYEMNRVFQVPNKRIEYLINVFNTEARKMIERSPYLSEAHLSTLTEEDLHPEETVSPFELNSIVTFTMSYPGRFLNIEDAKLINKALYSDISEMLATENPVAEISMQLGQPVKVNIDSDHQDWQASLRIALSSNRIAELANINNDIVKLRFETEFDMIHEKLVLILENLDLIREHL